MGTDLARVVRPYLRPVTALVLLIGLAVALAAFALAGRVATNQDQGLLRERARVVSALLVNSFEGIDTSLGVLGPVGASPDGSASSLFAQAAGPLVTGTTTTVGVATGEGTIFRVVTAVGDGLGEGDILSGARAVLAARAVALEQPRLVSDLVTEAGRTTLLLARAVGGKSVAYQESVLNPGQPFQSPPDSPFSNLRLALYASPEADADRLVLTTDADLPESVEDDAVELPFVVGADQWVLVVAAEGPLTGSLTRATPWLLLAGAVVTAVLAAAMAAVLARRRAYAMDLVTERTRDLSAAMQELGATRAFLDRLLASGPVVVLRAAVPDRQLSYVSPNIERVLGVTEQEALAPQFLRSLVPSDQLLAVDAAWDAVARGSSEREVIEFQASVGGGSLRWASAVLVPETRAAGDVVAVLAYVTDVDDRHRAEDARREAQEAAEDANRSKSQFLSRMSHELRTPLNSVLGFGQLLEIEDLPADQRDSVDHILKGGRHLLNLINEVLDISRIEAGELALSPEAVMASDLIGDAVDLMRPLAGQRGISVTVDGTGACECHVFADQQRVKQVLLNLLSNAIKYNRPQGTVLVSCHQGTEWLTITVTDTGMGIPAERLGLLFTAFERLGAEHGPEEGTGIGLALSRRLTEAMGGRLDAVSALGQGSSFTLQLPRVEGPVARYERLDRSAPPPAPARRVRRVVLHIEDNLANLTLVERIMQQRPGIDVIAAMYGRLGLALAGDHRPDLVLLDLHLPDMSGEQVLQRLRDDPATATIPVVIVSADATPGQVQRLLSAGAAAYLTKPIDVRELLRLIDNEIPQHEDETPQP